MAMSNSEFFHLLADRFMRHRVREMLDCFAAPLAVYSGNHLVVLHDRAELRSALAAYRRLITEAGVSQLRPLVHVEDMRPSGRFPIRVDWEHLDMNGGRMGLSRTRYFCHVVPGRLPLIEMIDCQALIVPLTARPRQGLLH